MEPEPALVGRGRAFLVRMRVHERAVEVDHVEPRIGARRPRLPACRSPRRRDPCERRRRRSLRVSATRSGPTRPRRTEPADRAAPPDRRSLRRHRRASPPDRPTPARDHGRAAAASSAPSPPTSRRSDPSSSPDHTTHERPRAPPRSGRHRSPTSRGRVELRFISEVPFWLGTCRLRNRSFPYQEGVRLESEPSGLRSEGVGATPTARSRKRSDRPPNTVTPRAVTDVTCVRTPESA